MLVVVANQPDGGKLRITELLCFIFGLGNCYSYFCDIL